METSQIFQCGPVLGNLAWGTWANFEVLDHDMFMTRLNLCRRDCGHCES